MEQKCYPGFLLFSLFAKSVFQMLLEENLSVENQKGIHIAQRCSVENQKGAIDVQSMAI